MSAETADWQNRTRLLTGDEGMDRLSRAHVLVIGLGGVGGIAAEMIARAGIGKMTIADGDVFEASNRNRQIGALLSTAGRSKTEVMAERLRDIHPELELETVNAYLKNETMTALLDQAPYDCVLDAIDSLSPKVQLLCHCVRKKIPVISCMGSGARLDPELVRCADISKTEHCTLARARKDISSEKKRSLQKSAVFTAGMMLQSTKSTFTMTKGGPPKISKPLSKQ